MKNERRISMVPAVSSTKCFEFWKNALKVDENLAAEYLCMSIYRVYQSANNQMKQTEQQKVLEKLCENFKYLLAIFASYF